MDSKRLAEVGVFSGLSKKELGKLAQWTDEVVVDEGHALATEGLFAHEFFVIEEGSAEVRQNGVRVASLGPGDFFGEIGLLDTDRRTASVLATTSMKLIVMYEREFRQMEQDLPTVATRIRTAIQSRLAR